MSTEVESWALLGEAVVAFTRRGRRTFALPPGLHRIPGPAVVLAERFVDSPVGPFLALSFGEPVRLGLRPGYFFGTSVLNSPKARRLGRQSWGFPYELGTLTWTSEPGVRGISWEERGIEVRGRVKGKPMPILVPVRTLQQRSDGPVVVPHRLRALARRSRVEISLDEDDPLVGWGGSHPGLTLSGVLLRRKPARHPRGLVGAFHAWARRPEPGVVGLKFDTGNDRRT